MRIVEWKEQVTDSGITLAGTSATVMKRGEVIGTQAIPMNGPAGQMAIAVVLIVRRFEDNRIFGMDANQCVCVEPLGEPLAKSDEAYPIARRKIDF